MKTILAEWYPLDDGQRASLLNDAVIVFDTNSLLTLYRLSEGDRARVVDLLDALKHRVWIPYQTALEFHKNRLKVVREQLEAYDDSLKRVGDLRGQIVDSVRSHPVLSQSEIRTEINDRLISLDKYLRQQYNERHPSDIRNPYERDGVLDAVTTLFDGRVGPRPSENDERLKEAQKRIDEKVPPGYEDAKKPIPERYGDFFLWRETLSYWGSAGQGHAGGLILVSEETKPDWWLKDGRDLKNQRLVQPRPELVREAFEAGLSPFWMLSLRRFFSNGAGHLGWDSTDSENSRLLVDRPRTTQVTRTRSTNLPGLV